jgi:hypothetical protein
MPEPAPQAVIVNNSSETPASMDIVSEVSSTTTSMPSGSSSAKVLGKKRQRNDGEHEEATGKQSYWCMGCSCAYDDIEGHISGASDTKRGKRCRRVAEYVVIVNSRHDGERIPWTPSEVNSDRTTTD